MEVEIPSPSVILSKSPILRPTPTIPLKKPVKPRNTALSKAAAKSATTTNGVHDGAITKPKQSKSRNGCLTCKKKRLKCDETHPHCQQCAKRNVQCEGYKKDFKWRSFEETSFNPNKPATKSKKAARSSSFTLQDGHSRAPQQNGGRAQTRESANYSLRYSPGLEDAFASAAHAIQGKKSPNGNVGKQQRLSPSQLLPGAYNLPPFDSTTEDYGDGLDPYSLPNTSSTSNDEGSGRSAGSTLSSGSPHLRDILLPGTDLNSPPDPSELRPPLSPLPYQPANLDHSSFDVGLPNEDDFDEEIVRQQSMLHDVPELGEMSPWMFRQPSPTPSETSTTSSKSSTLTILAQPKFDAASPEMLALRFDKQTCGILSIKDGPHENPWRNLIWPLGKDSPALYHAISSMIAFHGASDIPALRVDGMAHHTQSIKKLSQDINHMRTDTILATALALAFSEGWDHHTTTGIQHLRGVRGKLNDAVVAYCRNVQLDSLDQQGAMTMKFLCNTYVYMDVIARLTSLEEAHNFDLGELVATVNPLTPDPIELDPLMGCAVELFPIIGRVANLIQRVRNRAANNFPIVSEAMDLKEQLQQWQVPDPMTVERPEDMTSQIQHSVQTAEAYRYATMLYLHQAVPEIPSEPSGVLANAVLLRLASVPISSRAIIVQIFPLLAAGCEVTSHENRQWVLQRWDSMISRLRIGNVIRCLDIVQEVWRRRDTYEAEKQERLLRRYNARGMSNGGAVPPMLHSGKRKAQTTEALTEDSFFGALDDGMDDIMRPMKRRLTFDARDPSMRMPMMTSMPRHSPGGIESWGDLTLDLVEPHYTVRGMLHWLGVMKDQNWEVFLG